VWMLGKVVVYSREINGETLFAGAKLCVPGDLLQGIASVSDISIPSYYNNRTHSNLAWFVSDEKFPLMDNLLPFGAMECCNLNGE
jgi:hypothetical protein